ncbi:MAG: hypothetical protein ACM3UZ_17045 [Acidobacteriota bacterium]
MTARLRTLAIDMIVWVTMGFESAYSTPRNTITGGSAGSINIF